MGNEFLAIFNSFKGHKTSFRNEYKISNPTHLIDVAQSISIFFDATNLMIKKLRSSIDSQIKKEYKVIGNKYDSNTCILIQCLMQLEKDDKHRLKIMIETNILDKVNNPNYLMKFIHSPDDALNVSIAIGILDDYIEYLSGKEYSGPVKNIGDCND